MAWFVDKEVADKAIRYDILIEEEQVDCRSEKVPDATVNEDINVCLVCCHFSADAWLVIEDLMKQKVEKMTWICHACFHDLHTEQAILCDSCLKWFHFSCVGITKFPKSRN